MARFYGGVVGNRGEATRMGGASTGFRAYAQSTRSRVTVSYDAGKDEDDREINETRITIGGGWSTYYREHTIFINADDVAHALDTGDQQVTKCWERIQREFKKLNEIAPKAIERTNKRRIQEQRRQRRAEIEEVKRQGEIRAGLSDEERKRLITVLGIDHTALDADIDVALTHHTIELVGTHAFVEAKPKGCFQRYDFDLTAGQWVLPFEPTDLGIAEPIAEGGYSWRLGERKEEEVEA